MSPNNRDDNQPLTAIRVTKFEIASVAGDWQETTRRWRELSEDVQQATNFVWRHWECWHISRRTDVQIREAMDTLKAWHNSDTKSRGKKPKFSFQAVPKELQNELYHELTVRFSRLSSRVLVLVLNGIVQKITACQSATGNLPGWWSILLCRQGRPASIHPLPIPFDKDAMPAEQGAGSIIVPPTEPGGNFGLILRLWRNPREGKKGFTTEDRLELRCKGQKVQSQVAILRRIAAGEYAFRGSQLYQRDKKWFVAICYRMPRKAQGEGLDDRKVAYLRPSTRKPFRMRIAGRREEWIGGEGLFVGEIRRRLVRGRWNRHDGYRFAGSANKGHGKDRALGPVFKLSRAWKEFTKRANHGFASRILRLCIDAGVGRIVYFAPDDGQKERALLSTIGKTKRTDSSSWDWYQFQSLLSEKCKDGGPHIEIIEGGKARRIKAESAKTAGLKRGNGRKRL